MGILAYVHRNHLGDCTNGGISSTNDRVCIVNVGGPFEPGVGIPAVIMDNHARGCLRIVPAVRKENGQWDIAPGAWMMGGNYCATSDSRFSETAEWFLGHRFYGAIAIHDRQE